MKKKLAILLAAVMVAAMVPVSAFATSTNYLSGNAVTVKSTAVLNSSDAATLIIEDNKGNIYDYVQSNDLIFELNLTNAKWNKTVAGAVTTIFDEACVDVGGVLLSAAASVAAVPPTSEATNITDTSALIKIDAAEFAAGGAFVAGFAASGDKITIELPVEMTAAGEATVTINPVGTCPIAGGTYTFAIGASGATTTTIEKSITISESANEAIKAISILETAPGTLENGEKITLKLSKNFKFVNTNTGTGAAGDIVLAESYGTAAITTYAIVSDNEITINVTNGATPTLSKVVISNILIEGTSKASDGDVAEITLSGAGMTKQTLEVGTFGEYGYSFAVEDKDLPVLYSGSWDDNETLKVTFKETVADSWSHSRKTTFTFPTGVKVVAVDVKSPKNVTLASEDITAPSVTPDFIIDENKVTLTNPTTGAVTTKAEFGLVFTVSVSPEFTGDITCTIGGSALDEDTEVIVATAAMPFTVEVVTNEVNIDYRNVEVGDIIIKEAYEGALESGKTLMLSAENMSFEKGFTWEVTEGDLDIDDITIGTGANAGVITIDIDSESAKTPGTIVISDLSLYLDRSLPAGDYNLSVVNSDTAYDISTTFATPASDDAFFKNYDAGKDDPGFDIDEVVVADAYVKVVTAGRDQDDSTFTTQITVPIGAYEIKAGTKTVALDTPAYINEAGYTMMPLRGVVEALSGSAIISWDDATKTATILFGTRVISMTIGTKSMIINGTAIAMTSAPVIVNSRTFLPLRDLGYALGLSDNKIAWDDTTKTATLN